MTKFSIIIPCYNVERYITECLDSLLIQKVQSWEAICTNDGSTDKTGEILEAYAQRDSRIKVIHQENRGLSEARNVAVKEATGEWLYYLDSDDVISPWALDTYFNMSKDFPDVDILVAKLINTDDIGKCLRNEDVKCYSKDSVNVYSKDEEIIEVICQGGFQKNIFKRSVFSHIPWIGLSWCEERPYVAKCAVRSRGVAQLDVLCYIRRERQGSITRSKMSLAECNGYLDATISILQTFKDADRMVPYSLHRSLINKWMEVQTRLIVTRLSSEKQKDAWAYWFASLKKIRTCKPISFWVRFVVIMCRCFPYRWIAFLLCYIPDFLKRRGFHR